MAKQKSNRPTWSKLKPTVTNLEQSQLVKLVADLYRLSKDNQDYLHARFGVGDEPLAPYKKTIEECMFPDVYKNRPIQIAKAKGAISIYSKAVADPAGEAELMIFFVECGTDFSVNYGDIDSGFYNALSGMYRRAIEKVLSLPEALQGEFRARLREIIDSSSSIGWGYPDDLAFDFYGAFPDEE